MAAATGSGPPAVLWISLGLGVLNTLAIVFLAIMAWRQQRQQKLLHTEDVEIRHPVWETRYGKRELQVEVVNSGHCDFYVRAVRLESPTADRNLMSLSEKPSDPIRPGGHAFFVIAEHELGSFPSTLAGALVTVESNRGKLFRCGIVRAKLFPPS